MSNETLLETGIFLKQCSKCAILLKSFHSRTSFTQIFVACQACIVAHLYALELCHSLAPFAITMLFAQNMCNHIIYFHTFHPI